MKLLIEIAGWGMLLLGVVHVFFPKHFDWKTDLAQLSLINRQMAEVHMFFVAFFVALMGLLCITSANLLLHTGLGRRVSLGISIFWGARLLVQHFWYSPRLWRGKPFETIVHVVFTMIWLTLVVLFAMAAFGNSGVSNVVIGPD